MSFYTNKSANCKVQNIESYKNIKAKISTGRRFEDKIG